jgi:signal transduction histidine kinase
MIISFIRKRLNIIFTSVVVAFNVLAMTVVLYYIHVSILNVSKHEIRDDIEKEFIPQYRQDPDGLSRIYSENYLQILNKSGDIVGGTIRHDEFTLGIDRDGLRSAFAGDTVFQKAKVGNTGYLISYFPLDKNHTGRVAMSLNKIREFEEDFLRLILLSLPLMLLSSYIVSRFLVGHALKPAVDVCTFQEHFLSNITHELRSPLSSMRGNLEVSLRRDRTTEEYKDFLSIILKETNRIIDLLRNMHILASSKLRPLELTKKRIDLKMIIQELINSYMPEIRNRKITLEIAEISDAICSCDEGLIKVVITNLIENAVKYTPEGGVIKIGAFKDHRKIYLKIENTSRGLRKEEIRFLFEPFYRGESIVKSNIEGQGLGLYIARYIILSHHGDIRIDMPDKDYFAVTVSFPSK